MGKQIHKMWYILTMEYYSALKSESFDTYNRDKSLFTEAERRMVVDWVGEETMWNYRLMGRKVQFGKMNTLLDLHSDGSYSTI